MKKTKVERISDFKVGEKYEIYDGCYGPYIFLSKTKKGELFFENKNGSAALRDYDNNTFYHLAEPEPTVADYIGKWYRGTYGNIGQATATGRDTERIYIACMGWHNLSCIADKVSSGEWQIADHPSEFFKGE